MTTNEGYIILTIEWTKMDNDHISGYCLAFNETAIKPYVTWFIQYDSKNNKYKYAFGQYWYTKKSARIDYHQRILHSLTEY